MQDILGNLFVIISKGFLFELSVILIPARKLLVNSEVELHFFLKLELLAKASNGKLWL